jgi:drug/metabolite transporter (DMT)-like permease
MRLGRAHEGRGNDTQWEEKAQGQPMEVEPSLFKAVLYGILGAVAVCLGKGLQKYGVEFIAHPKKTFREKKFLKIFVWLLGTAGIVSSAFFIFAACAYGSVSLVAALSGTGLVALAFFSAFVLKEPIGKSELLGITAIIAGTVLAGYFDGFQGVRSYGIPNPAGGKIGVGNMVVFSIAVAAVSAASAVWSIRSGYRHFGVIFGSISGFCGGISVFFQKAAMIHCRCSDIFEDIPGALANPYFYLFAFTGIGDFLVTQYALTKSKAVTIVPCYQSWYMLVPVIGGIVTYHERFNVIQAAGVALLTGGIVLLSMYVAGSE